MSSHFNVAVLLRHYLYLGYSLLADAHARLYSPRSPHARTRPWDYLTLSGRRVHALIPAPVRDLGVPQVLSEHRETGDVCTDLRSAPFLSDTGR